MQGCARDVGQAEAERCRRLVDKVERRPHMGLFWLVEHPRRVPAAHLGARISSIWEGTLPASRNSGADQRRRWTKFLALEATTQFSSARREWSHYRHFWYRGLLCGWPIGAWGRSSTLKVILEMGHGITSSALPAAELTKVLVGVVPQCRARPGCTRRRRVVGTARR